MTDVLGNAVDFFGDFGAHSAAGTAPTSTLAMAMLFGSIAVASTGLATRAYLTGDHRAFEAASSPRSRALDLRNFASVYALLHHLTIFGAILLYAYLCEHHPPFAHSSKSYDRDEFFFLTALLLFASVYTWKRNGREEPPECKIGVVATVVEDNDVLNRHQTEEWKGIMQFVFLLYHYYHAEEAYNAIRVMITCYVWMTGFGNFSFFYIKADYGIVRVLQMLWRLNFLVIFLCLTQGTTYILYYICLLHTYYFLMVYFTMKTGSDLNYSKWGIRSKMGMLALIIAIVWDVNSGLFRVIHFPFLGKTPMLGAESGSMWEWYFRSSLDHWSTFLGMIFALNFPITSLFYRKLESQPPIWHWLAKATMGIALLVAFYAWLSGPFRQNKMDYNYTNAYFAFIPLITYIYFRNLTPYLRAHHLALLHRIGKTTLETYLMQHHIWLTSNAKSLLTLIPGWPKVNMLLVTILYYLISRRLYDLTLYLRGIILPNDKIKCFQNLGGLICVVVSFYSLASMFKSFGMLSLTSVGIVSLIFGTIIYQTIMETTWEAFKVSALANRVPTTEETMVEKMIGPGAAKPNYDSTLAQAAPPMVGLLFLCVVGLTWHGMAQVGASPIQALPAGCEAHVNDGVWIPVNPCNEETKGIGYRDHGIASYAICGTNGGAFVWGWNETAPGTHCRFTHRDPKQLRKMLNHRTITFVGDSITRFVYHAMLRQMGMAGAGAYNTKVPKWSDITNTIGDTTVEFEWAALASDQVVKIRDIIARPTYATHEKDTVRPDLVVMGGGAWDRLHVYATDEDRESHRATVRDLAKEIRLARSANIPVAWIVPTTINSAALLTEEKQKNIKEEDIEGMRALYAQLGIISSASFVLDGPAFTASRVTESYDGVHYPHTVYDAGAQILVNAMDWILLKRVDDDPVKIPKIGSMANPPLGLMMLCFVAMGLVCFDGFMGFSYLASFFASGVMPSDLDDEAFEELHARQNLPYEREDAPQSGASVGGGITIGSHSRASRSGVSSRSGRSTKSGASGRTQESATSNKSDKSDKSKNSQASIDDEIAALLGTTSKRLEMTELS
jgi:N-acetylneuraminate 9-O-acetyltransferase